MIKLEIIDQLIENNILLARSIRKKNKVNGSSDEAYSFIITILKILHPKLSDIEIQNSVTDDWNDGDLDAILINNKKREISIFDVKREKTFEYKEIKLFQIHIKNFILNQKYPLKGLNKLVTKRIKHARKLVRNGYTLKVYVARKGIDNPHNSVSKLTKDYLDSNVNVKSYELLNVDQILNYLIMSNEYNFYEWQIDSGKNRYIGDNDGNSEKIIIKNRHSTSINSIICLLPLYDISTLASDFHTKKLDLFNKNVRIFQKNKGLSNKITNTLKTDPSEFHLFHNGLTFSCKSIDERNDQIFQIIDPQIINGCQTVNTIHELRKKDELLKKRHFIPLLKKAFIMCRFYALNEQYIEKVCEATNTQLKISLSDLRSNDDVQKIIEKAFSLKGIVYKRKRSSMRNNEIGMASLAQWIFSCRFGQPANAKNKKSKLFELPQPTNPSIKNTKMDLLSKGAYKSIFNSRNLDIEFLLNLYEINKSVNAYIKLLKKKVTFERDADLHFMAGLYELRNESGTDKSKLMFIRKQLKVVIKKLRAVEGTEYSFNKIFTKNSSTWLELKKMLVNYR